jgi:hypothetical protein
MVGAFLDEIRHIDLSQSRVARLGLRLSPEAHDELASRLWAILAEFEARPADPDGRPYAVFLAVHEDVTRDSPAG